MHERHYLVADDCPLKLRRLKEITEAGAPHRSVIHTASSAREALELIGMLGKRIDTAVIDFDFLGETDTGADIIKAQREANKETRIVCATAREGTAFRDAEVRTLASGANLALCATTREFDGQLAAFSADA